MILNEFDGSIKDMLSGVALSGDKLIISREEL
jgi:hypothetical protein